MVNRVRLGARLARAVVQVAYELLEMTQVKFAGHHLDTAGTTAHRN